jgi:hypothetical protein
VKHSFEFHSIPSRDDYDLRDKQQTEEDQRGSRLNNLLVLLIFSSCLLRVDRVETLLIALHSAKRASVEKRLGLCEVQRANVAILLPQGMSNLLEQHSHEGFS